ncbi:hypothetical protein [uncultured Rikenella sp.]|uniref:hypothetical protein n=1 Tax=uncultured Rikenella sp. TaxID=368003 RepID=UPI0025CF2D44|nr:hypothetical protein [uncultured Rikenella sp.]
MESMLEDQVKEIRQYIELGRRMPVGQIRRNRWVYRGSGLAAAAAGVVAAVMVGGAGGFGLRWLWRSCDWSELAEQLTGLGLVMGMILVGRAVGIAVWSRLRSRFFCRGLRPLVTIRPEAGDPYIGRMFLDREGRVAVVYGRMRGRIYRIFGLKAGLPRRGYLFLRAGAGREGFLAEPDDGAAEHK